MANIPGKGSLGCQIKDLWDVPIHTFSGNIKESSIPQGIKYHTLNNSLSILLFSQTI